MPFLIQMPGSAAIRVIKRPAKILTEYATLISNRRNRQIDKDRYTETRTSTHITQLTSSIHTVIMRTLLSGDEYAGDFIHAAASMCSIFLVLEN